MAKNKKSFFDTVTSQKEIKEAAKQIQKASIGDLPGNDVKKSGNIDADEPGKLMHLYVDGDHHRQAKLSAITRGMKLGEYIEWLIDQDKENL